MSEKIFDRIGLVTFFIRLGFGIIASLIWTSTKPTDPCTSCAFLLLFSIIITAVCCVIPKKSSDIVSLGSIVQILLSIGLSLLVFGTGHIYAAIIFFTIYVVGILIENFHH